MNEGSGSFFSNLSLIRGGSRLDDIEPFLEMLPHPGLLIDRRDGRILLANAQFASLVAYSRGELNGANITAFFPGHDLPALLQAAADPAKSPPCELAGRGPTRLPVKLMQSVQGQRGHRLLLVLQPADIHARPFDQHWLAHFWQNIQALAAAGQKDDLPTSLQNILAAGSAIAGASYLAVYRLAAEYPTLLRLAHYGAQDTLPEHISAQEMVQLSQPRQWQTGQRAGLSVQRAARAAGLAYLASAPLGQSRAMTGLVVLGGVHLPAGELALRTANLLAARLTAVLDNQALLEGLQAQIADQQLHAQVNQAIEQGSRQGILRVDAALRIRHMNLAAEAMLGYTAPHAQNQPVEAILIGAEPLQSALHVALAGNPTYNLSEVQLYRRSGEAFPARLRILPILHESQVAEVVIFVEDLSEQEQTRQQTQQLENRALLGEITAVFAHEVRNPINNISTGLQLMAMNLPPGDANQESIARMLQDCDRLAELMKSVLAFSRTAEYDMEKLEIGLLLRRLLERLRPRLARPELCIDLQIDPSCPPILGNLRALEQVFANLMINAAQAMGEKGGSLILKAYPLKRDQRRFSEISVADTGPGIPKEVQEKIFTPFFTTQRDGTGLGLAIAKRIITAHRGAIRLDSFPGGTIFYVQLPAVEDF
jgi:PAS domain S-box-containing protein